MTRARGNGRGGGEGQSNTHGRDRKAAFRDVSVVEQGLPKHLVLVEG